MRLIYALVISLALSGCATDEQGRLIRPEDTTWIQKGVTTRSEIVQRFGPPRFETPLQSSTTSTTTTTTDIVQGQPKTTTRIARVNGAPMGTKATYPYTRSQSGVPFNVNVRLSQFWVIYDEKGIVQDYGFVGDASNK
jgi:hypothetical protein